MMFLLRYTARVASVCKNRNRCRELAEANRLLETFSYSVAHDLRGPLRHVAGLLGQVRRESEASLSPRARARFLKALQGLSRSEALLEEMLTFHHLNQGEPRRLPVDMNALVRAVREELSFESAGRRVVWRVGRLPRASGERMLLRRVWQNLLSNALKFTRHRPRTVLEVSGRAHPGRVVYEVRDNGLGFDPAQSGRLFKPFSRLHAHRGIEGYGIGLANVERIVSRHGGTVWAEGREGKGAAFFFSLPRAS